LANDGGRVRLELRSVSALLPHEETIDSLTREMVARLRKDGIQKDPIIVDGATGVVLDGMHRLSAFLELGISQVACSPVEYASPDISVGRWLRIYRPLTDNKPEEIMEEVGLTGRCTKWEALAHLERREAPVAAFCSGDGFLPPTRGNAEEGFAVMRRADRFAQAHSWERSFVEEGELEGHLEEGREIVILAGRFDKGDVLKAGLARHPFPCKTSMHVIDPRPVAVNVPLTELESGSRDTLDKRLSKSHFEMLPSNSVYEGRRYKERLLVLS
jgi:hypothetical protein